MSTKLSLPTSEDEVRSLAKSITGEKRETHPESSDYFLSRLRAHIAKTLSAIVSEDLSFSDVNLVPVPPKYDGDYSIQVPTLMKDMKRYRGEILPALEAKLSEGGEYSFSSLSIAGPFLNFSLEPSALVSPILQDIENFGENYGKTQITSGQKVIVEYSSPNMGKSLHVGHLGTTLLGEGLANIFEAGGGIVFRVSHLGDWGTPCGMLQVGTEMFGSLPEIMELRDSPSQYYSTIYSKFNEAQKEDPALREKAKAAFAALENGKNKAKEFWTTVRNESADEFDRIYDQLNISFDTYLGEAFYEPYLKNTIDDLLEKKVAHLDDAAIVADLDDVGLKTVLLQKSDGATTYFARDVVALYKRKELFDYDLALYVVGSEQTLHFRQLFELGNRMNYLQGAEAAHVPIGLITQKGSKISSRSGGALGAEELKDAVYERAKAQVDESLGEEESEEVRTEIAEKLTNGALFYNQLLTAPGKSTDFNLDKILDMKGKSGAYLQYAAVRGKSILRKVGAPEVPLSEISSEVVNEIDPSAVSLTKKLGELSEILTKSITQQSPHPIAHYLNEVGQEVNHFYQRVRIKDLESPTKDLYLHLLKGSVQVIENGLRWLNIEVPERM